VLDMIMPGLSGRETFYRLKEIDPGIRVLLYSAHSMDEDVHLMLEKGALGFIQKPYRIAALSQKIAEMLSGSPVGLQSEPHEAAEETILEKVVHLSGLPS
jgi:DNA-binding NarL/FixJ family response regulator